MQLLVFPKKCNSQEWDNKVVNKTGKKVLIACHTMTNHRELCEPTKMMININIILFSLLLFKLTAYTKSTYAHAHTLTHRYMNAHRHARTLTCMHTHPHILTYTLSQKRMQAHTCAKKINI